MIETFTIMGRWRVRWTGSRVVMIAALLLGYATAGAAGWDDAAWPYRREVTIGAGWRSPTLPGDDVAVLTMPTAGLARPNGSDIRVMNGEGAEIPSRILMAGPGDVVRLAFALQGSTGQYYVYFGNLNPAAPRKELEIRRGVLMETWDYSGGPVQDLEQARKVLADLKEPIGRCLRDRIYLGYNPFGPQSRIASLFTGHLVCPVDGEYTFACSSQNASFLLIDDRLVVENGGVHKPQTNLSKQGKVTLTSGLHKMTLYHVTASGEPIVAVAWRPPGSGKIEAIPARGFAPFVRARPGPLEQYAKDRTIDFLPAFGGESFVADRYYQRYSFHALSTGRGGDTAQWQWDFGDGQTSGKPSAEHVYLTPGPYTVTLTAKTDEGVLTRTNRIVVARPWDDLAGAVQDKPALHARIVAAYDFAALSPQANAQAVLLLDHGGEFDDLARAGLAFLARSKASDEAISEALPVWADSMVLHGKAEMAANGLLVAARMTTSATVRAAMTTKAGCVCLDNLGDAKRARTLLEDVLREYPTAAEPVLRQAHIGIGDVCRSGGDYAKALAAYQSAKPLADADAKVRIMRGDFALHVEEYLRHKDYDAADQWLSRWADALPADKLDGYWSFLRVGSLLAQARPADAVMEAQTLVRVNSASHYAPAMLLRCADAYDALNQPDRAKETLKDLVAKYPESSFAADAAIRLDLPASRPMSP